MSIAEIKKRSLLKRRKRAIVLSVVAVVILAIALVFILDYANERTYVDPADQTEYAIRKEKGTYKMYDTSGNPLATEILPTDTPITVFVTKAGTMVRLDPSTGAAETYMAVDLEGSEVNPVVTRLLIFPYMGSNKILSIEVKNADGTYTFARIDPATGKESASASFVLKQDPFALIDQTTVTTFCANAGNPMTLLKLENTEKNPLKPLSQYGLEKEIRINEDGEEYNYEPAYYIITGTDGSRHKIIIGDRVIPNSFTASDGTPITMGGYYAQYAELSGLEEKKRESVYVLDNTTAYALLSIEDYITPMLTTEQMTDNTYYNIENFAINVLGKENQYQEKISFSYIDMSLRENTMLEAFPFRFHGEMSGYTASSTALDNCLKSLYNPTFVDVCKFNPSQEDLAEYGLYQKNTGADGKDSYLPLSPYSISFSYIIRDAKTNEVSGTIDHLILISEKTEQGTYYAYSILDHNIEGDNLAYTFDTILEIDNASFQFLEWDRFAWISQNFIDDDIGFVQDITLQTPDYNASFIFNNSLTAADDDVRSANLSIIGSDSHENKLTTFGKMTVTDVNGYTWHITPTSIEVYAGNSSMEIAPEVSYYEYNSLGTKVRCRTGYINCQNYRVEVNPDTVRVLYNSGKVETFIRYSTDHFRNFYRTLLFTSITDSYEMSKEQEAALLADPNALLMTLTITASDEKFSENGSTKTEVYRFYKISARKAYLTINGGGGFYVVTDRIEKIVADAQRFFALEPIDPFAKT